MGRRRGLVACAILLAAAAYGQEGLKVATEPTR